MGPGSRPARPASSGESRKAASGGWFVACNPQLVETPQRVVSRAAVALTTHHSPPTTYRRSPSSPARREAPRSGILPCGFNPTLVTSDRTAKAWRSGSCLYASSPPPRHPRRTGAAGAIGYLVVAAHPPSFSSSPMRREAPRSGILWWLRVANEPARRRRRWRFEQPTPRPH